MAPNTSPPRIQVRVRLTLPAATANWLPKRSPSSTTTELLKLIRMPWVSPEMLLNRTIGRTELSPESCWLMPMLSLEAPEAVMVLSWT